MFTSATTGYPKGAMLSHYNVLNNGLHTGDLMEMTSSDVAILPLPFHHCFGMVLCGLATMNKGASIVLPSENFDPSKIFECVEKY